MNESFTEFCYPEQLTYYICWDNDRISIQSYGEIAQTQCLYTHWVEIDYYEDETTWLQVLVDNGINPFPEPEDETDL